MNLTNSTVVVSYWNGNLPKISELHFLSFVRKNDGGFKYYLYIDTDKNINCDVFKQAPWIRKYPEIEIKYFSLWTLMEKYRIKPFNLLNASYFKLFRFVRFKFFHFVCRYLTIRKSRYFKKYVINHYNEAVGFSFSHEEYFSCLSEHLTYRSDCFRSLIANEYPNESVLYVDLDICFIKKFSEINWSNSFTSPWGQATFANTSFLFLSLNGAKKRKILLDEFRKISPAWPWILYSEERLRTYEIGLIPIQQIDPAWSAIGPVAGDTQAFMKGQRGTLEICEWLDSNCIAYHWHNQWSLTPDQNSPYGIYMERYSKSG